MKESLKSVQVTWTDSTSIDPWTDIEEIHTEPNIITSFGILVTSNSKCLVLALNMDVKEESVSCIMIIPRVNIIEIRQGFLGLVGVDEEEEKD